MCLPLIGRIHRMLMPTSFGPHYGTRAQVETLTSNNSLDEPTFEMINVVVH